VHRHIALTKSTLLSLAVPPWVDAVSTSESWDVNRHTTRCASPIFVVLQCEMVSGRVVKKRRSAPSYGSYVSRRTLRHLTHVIMAVTGILVMLNSG